MKNHLNDATVPGADSASVRREVLHQLHPAWIAALIAFVMGLLHASKLQPWTLDDAFISIRYAENFVAGHGIVFNPGEKVEGYTNFLWVMLTSIGIQAGMKPVLVVNALGTLFAVSTICLIACSHLYVNGISKWTSLIAALLLGTCGVWTRWWWSGMEVSMVGFWYLLAAITHFAWRTDSNNRRMSITSGIACAMAMMSRPDAGLILLVIGLDRMRVAHAWKSASTRLFLLSSLGIYIPYFVSRWIYYGLMLPNTFYAKVSNTSEQVARGFGYLQSFLPVGGVILLLALALLFIPQRTNRINRGLIAVSTFVLLHISYTVLVGGDVFWGWRFYASIMPLICMLAAIFIGSFGLRPGTMLLITGLLMTFNIGQNQNSRQLRSHGKVSAIGKQVGEMLHERADTEALLAVNIAGSIPHFSKLNTIDMLGLNDRHIAAKQMPNMGKGKAGHEKGDADYVLSRKPDYIIIASSKGGTKPYFVGDRQLLKHEEFKEKYVYRRIRISKHRKVGMYLRQPKYGGLWLKDLKKPGEKDKDLVR